MLFCYLLSTDYEQKNTSKLKKKLGMCLSNNTVGKEVKVVYLSITPSMQDLNSLAVLQSHRQHVQGTQMDIKH